MNKETEKEFTLKAKMGLHAKEIDELLEQNVDEISDCTEKKKLTTGQIDKIVSRILSDYRGWTIGKSLNRVTDQQLHFRIRRTLIAAQNGELEVEL